MVLERKPRLKGLSVKINSKPAASQAGGRKQGAAAYALLAAAATDVDSNKHKKNPFHERYVQLCLTEFPEVRFQNPWSSFLNPRDVRGCHADCCTTGRRQRQLGSGWGLGEHACSGRGWPTTV